MNVTLQRLLCNVHNTGALSANGSHSRCPEAARQGTPPEIPVPARPSGRVLGAAVAARSRIRCSTQLITIDHTPAASRLTLGGTLAEPASLDPEVARQGTSPGAPLPGSGHVNQ